MKSLKKSRLALSVLAATGIFAGCGGGGGGGSGGTTSTAPSTGSPPTFQSSSIDSTAPPSPTYSLGSEELIAFNLLNAERLACGFGAVKQSTQLDAAALNHTTWMAANNYAATHYQEAVFSSGPNAGQPTSSFTGVNPIDRIVFAGYAQSSNLAITDEGSETTNTSNKTGYGVKGIRGLLAAPYHMAGLVGEFRDIGITVRSSAVSGADITATAGSAPRTFLWANLGWTISSSPQLLSSTDVATYPCQGTSGTAYRLTNETPNPVPGRDLLLNPLGQPVFIMGRVGNTIAITSAQMTQVSNGALVSLRSPITSANDPVGPCARGCYLSHMAYVIPDAALLPNTQYQVNITGTNNGVAFTRSFTFTTGAISA